ncbi:hypothetical protein D1007_55982 [Hordeum vulgare]|nr:hypothetical protein D1007_55982 [Hordeum vulgare]
MVVSIGPYHRKLGQFEATEEVKLVTACQFVSSSSGSFEEICAAIRPLVSLSRSLYEPLPRSLFEHVLPGYTDDDLVRMMLLDGCFLLQYMLMYTARDKLSSSLLCYFDSNQASISNDIMLLENQIPWAVIETLRRFKEVPVEEFVAKMGRTFQVRKEKEREEFDLGDGYKPPHLLGLLRFYKTRHTFQVPKKNEQKLPALGSSSASQVPTSDQDRQISMSKSISAIELAEIGIKLMASKTTKLVDMGIEKTPLSGNIFLAPLLLDDIRSCWLVNMAALEVCLATGVRDDEEPVVCSYLALLAMLMDREEDVHKLRSKRLVQGELTNKETLDFFKTLIKHISGGSLYIRILEEIEDYKLKRRIWIKICEYVYQNKKAIVTVLSLIGVLAGIFKALLSVKHGQQ